MIASFEIQPGYAIPKDMFQDELLNTLEKLNIKQSNSRRYVPIGNDLEFWFSAQDHFSIRMYTPRERVIRIDSFEHKVTIDTDAKVVIIDDRMAFQYK